MVAMSATTAIYALLDAQPEITDPVEARPATIGSLLPEIRFEDVRFGYSSRRAEARSRAPVGSSASNNFG